MRLEDIDRAYELKSQLMTLENLEGEYADNPNLKISCITLCDGTQYFIPSFFQEEIGKLFRDRISDMKERIINEISEL